MKKILVLLLLFTLAACTEEEVDNEINSSLYEDLEFEKIDSVYFFEYKDEYFTASTEEVLEDVALLKETYGNLHYRYLGSIENVNIYRREYDGIYICTEDIVSPTHIGDGYYVYGGGSSSCNESTFLVEDDQVALIAGGYEIDGTVEDFNLTPKEVCSIPRVCLIESEYREAVRFNVSNQMQSNDDALLKSVNPNALGFIFIGVVDGFKLYREHNHDYACTMDIMPDTILSFEYVIPGGPSGSCYERVFAVRNDEIFQLSGYGHDNLREMNVRTINFCRMSSVCRVNVINLYPAIEQSDDWECTDSLCTYVGNQLPNSTFTTSVDTGIFETTADNALIQIDLDGISYQVQMQFKYGMVYIRSVDSDDLYLSGSFDFYKDDVFDRIENTELREEVIAAYELLKTYFDGI